MAPFRRRNVVNTSKVYDPFLHMEKPKDPNVSSSKDDNKDQDKSYDRRKKELDDKISQTRNSMMYSNESLGSLAKPSNSREYPYVDKDNYKQYLGLKKKSNVLSQMFFNFFWVIYSLFVIYFVFKWASGFLYKLPVIGVLFGEDDTSPNWGMIIAPIIIYTIYKSFQEYSFSKNIF